MAHDLTTYEGRQHFYEENRPDTWEDCPVCEGCHPADFYGDCRDDYNRWPSDKAIERLARDGESPENGRPIA